MRTIDWLVLGAFLAFVAAYGVWKTRGKKDIQDYFLANKSTPWYFVTISIMATQASAITFLSTPGQAYVDGMRFVQFYFGLPVAMVILSITAVPIYHRLKVYTAYEYLEERFDLKNRALGSILFLIQRGLAAGFTILAPALIISVILGWDFRLTILLTGGLVILYTASGGTDAVSKTHLLQMMIITAGMGTAFYMIFRRLPEDISFSNAVSVAGKLGRLNIINFAFDWKDRYNFWSGLIGGAFLALSYFGTDQSQVQRYLTGRSIAESRKGLLANGVLKVPMQFVILFIGAMIFVFYQFVTPPLFFNPVETAAVKASPYGQAYAALENDYARLNAEKQDELRKMLSAIEAKEEAEVEETLIHLRKTRESELGLRREAVKLIKQRNPLAETNDTNYIFLSFVTRYLPAGLLGLILAAILSASMSASSAELNALASVTVVDVYRRVFRKNGSERHYLRASKAATVFWGIYAIAFAQFASHLGSLIEAVNILGSLFYGTILGMFLVAFYFKRIGGHATFAAALVAEAVVLACFFFTPIPFLWFNVIGAVILIVLAHILNPLFRGRAAARG
ncbi:MAG: sodium:solute symporter [Candidatus Aminicenantes bacterium]|nr:sodium:solute symporter [Candidatus Aminicenantes bacterium]